MNKMRLTVGEYHERLNAQGASSRAKKPQGRRVGDRFEILEQVGRFGDGWAEIVRRETLKKVGRNDRASEGHVR